MRDSMRVTWPERAGSMYWSSRPHPKSLRCEDKQISLTDPDARSMVTSGKDTGIVGPNHGGGELRTPDRLGADGMRSNLMATSPHCDPPMSLFIPIGRHRTLIRRLGNDGSPSPDASGAIATSSCAPGPSRNAQRGAPDRSTVRSVFDDRLPPHPIAGTHTFSWPAC
jgi:hypothetical protein